MTLDRRTLPGSLAGASRVGALALALASAIGPACAGGPGSGTEGESATSTTSGSTSAAATSVASAASTGTAIASSSDSETSGCAFLCSPDGGPPSGECDPWTQNCPEGEKCNAWAQGGVAWDANKCVPVDPDPDGVNEPCSVEGSNISGVDSCVKGAMCWDVDPETNTGVCVGLCQGSPEQCTSDPASCCPEGSVCYVSGGGILILCLQVCDPFIQDCEARGYGCYPVSERFQCAKDVSGDQGAAGDPCEFINVCDPGTYCGEPGSYPGCDLNAIGCCVPFCSLAAPECVIGTECRPWYDPMEGVPAGYEDLGACVIP